MSILQPTAAAHLIIEPIFPGSLILSQIIINGMFFIGFKYFDSSGFVMSKIPWCEDNNIKLDLK